MRDFQRIEKGLHIVGENSNVGVKYLFGSVDAGSIAEHDDAELGSIYIHSVNGQIYQKKIAGSGTNKWVRLANLDDITYLRWRKEDVVALTAQAAPISGSTIDLAANPLSDDEAPTLVGADFQAGISHILFGKGGTAKLMLVSVVAGDVITLVDAVDPVANNYTYIVKNYLPDSPDAQEKSAIVLYNGSDYVKIADFNWEFADGIKLAASYAAASGNITSADTVQIAVQKLDGNVDALNSAVGAAQGQTSMGAYTGSTVLTNNTSAKANIQELGNEAKSLRDTLGNGAGASSMGTYTGDILTDNATTKQNIQELSDFAEEASKRVVGSGITTAQIVDSVLVDNYEGAIWDLVLSLDSNKARKIMLTIHGVHNGIATADASEVDDTIHSKLLVGTPFNHSVSVVLSGTGAAQTMGLEISASAAVSVKATRRVIK